MAKHSASPVFRGHCDNSWSTIQQPRRTLKTESSLATEMTLAFAECASTELYIVETSTIYDCTIVSQGAHNEHRNGL